MSRTPGQRRPRRPPREGQDERPWIPVRRGLDNPLTWALPLMRVGGVTVSLHAVFILFAAFMLLRSFVDAGETAPLLVAPRLMALCMAVLLLVALVHELGHCAACRWSGGEADEALLWPLGGLADCRPRHDWKAHLIAALGGPAVNLLICVVAALLLRLNTGTWLGTALPSLLSLDDAFGLGQNWSWPTRLLMLVNWTSLLLLLVNLAPIMPLDGGRILQALLWPVLGYARATQVALVVGYLGALLLGLAGIVAWNPLIMGVALVAGAYCFQRHRESESAEALGAGGAPLADAVGPPEPPQAAAEPAPPEDAERDEAAVDAILAKIRSGGMASLSGAEKRLLRRVTQRRRRAERNG